MSEAVFKPAEDPVIHPRLDALAQIGAERTIDRAARLLARREQERQIDKAELRHTIGEIARRLIAERQNAVFDQPQNLFGAIAEIHDVPDIFDVDAVAELRLQGVADEFERARERGCGRSVAAHADCDWFGHCDEAESLVEGAQATRQAAGNVNDWCKANLKYEHERQPKGRLLPCLYA